MKKKKVKHSVGHLTLEIYKRSSKNYDEVNILLHSYPPITLILNSRQCPEYTPQMEKDGFLLIAIDPRAPLEEITRFLKPLLTFKKEITKTTESKRKISERLEWLKLVDRVEKENPFPTRRTFNKLALLESKDENCPFSSVGRKLDRKISEYVKGKILVKTPEYYPLRTISNAEVRSYKIKHNLLIPHK